MKTSLRNALLAGGIAALVMGGLAHSAGFFTNGVPVAGGTQYPTTLPLTGLETVPADTNLPSGLNPASEAITTGQLASFGLPWSEPRNYLDNGAMDVAQQGTLLVTGGTTSLTYGQFATDRWFADVNVTSGAVKTQNVSTPVPAGFQHATSVYRNSGSLTQPVCLIQEIETQRSVSLAGKNVVFSAYLQGMSALSSTANAVNMYVITGTGTDQGLATLTANPAVTPAWTNISTVGSAVATLSTSAYSRFSTAAIAIPSTATEVGVELCYTPTGTATANDGFFVTGVQLEAVSSTVAGPSTYDFLPAWLVGQETRRFYYQLTEANFPGLSGTGITGLATSASAQVLSVPLPSTMRGSVPVVAIPTTGTFSETIGTANTTWVSPAAGTCSVFACTITAGNTTTALSGIVLLGNGGTGVIVVHSDVVM